MKKLFETPKMEVLVLANNDILTFSYGDPNDDIMDDPFEELLK